MYNICISIIYVYSFHEAQATVLRRSKQVTMFEEVTQTSGGRVRGEREAGSYCRSEAGASMVQIDLQGKHLLDYDSTSYSIIVSHISDLLCVGLKVIVALKAPIVRSYVQRLLQLFLKSVVGSSPSTVKGLKDALNEVFWHHLVWAPNRSTISKNSCNTEEVHSLRNSKYSDEYILTALLAIQIGWLITLWLINLSTVGGIKMH